MQSQDKFKFDPKKLLKQIELGLPLHIHEYLSKLVATAGRSLDELIVELLDKNLQDHQSSWFEAEPRWDVSSVLGRSWCNRY